MPMEFYRYSGAFYCRSCILIVTRLDLLCMGGSKHHHNKCRRRTKASPVSSCCFDRPLHCDICGKFLENQLNVDGLRYVADAVGRGWADPQRTACWSRFYLGDYEPTRYFDRMGFAVVAM